MAKLPTGSMIQVQILRIIKDGKIHTKDEVVEKLAKYFQLTKEQKLKKIKKRNAWNKKVIAEISNLRINGYLKNPVLLAKFRITSKGRNVRIPKGLTTESL